MKSLPRLTGNRKTGKGLTFLLSVLFLCIVSGCATVPSITYTPAPQVAVPSIPGFYHRMARGQTLWVISQMYNVDIDELVRINRISDTARIESGRLILIPGRQKPQGYGVNPGTPLSEHFAWPVRGQVISTFGQNFNNMVNKGLNIRASLNSDVIAARSGKVVFSDDNLLSFGKTIIIEHSGGFSTVYARNSAIFVKPGDYINKGAVIAKVGRAGRDKGNYLHFEIRKGCIPQNPYFYLP